VRAATGSICRRLVQRPRAARHSRSAAGRNDGVVEPAFAGRAAPLPLRATHLARDDGARMQGRSAITAAAVSRNKKLSVASRGASDRIPPTLRPDRDADCATSEYAAQVTSTASVAATDDHDTAAYQGGLRDRAAWEEWFNSLQGDYKTGAFYWSSQRSLPHPGRRAVRG